MFYYLQKLYHRFIFSCTKRTILHSLEIFFFIFLSKFAENRKHGNDSNLMLDIQERHNSVWLLSLLIYIELCIIKRLLQTQLLHSIQALLIATWSSDSLWISAGRLGIREVFVEALHLLGLLKDLVMLVSRKHCTLALLFKYSVFWEVPRYFSLVIAVGAELQVLFGRVILRLVHIFCMEELEEGVRVFGHEAIAEQLVLSGLVAEKFVSLLVLLILPLQLLGVFKLLLPVFEFSLHVCLNSEAIFVLSLVA